jgi:hypothetical protein
VAECSAEAKIPACVRGGINEIKDQRSVAFIPDALLVGNQLDMLPYICAQQHIVTSQVVLGQKWTVGDATNVSTKSGRGVGIAALSENQISLKTRDIFRELVSQANADVTGDVTVCYLPRQG